MATEIAEEHQRRPGVSFPQLVAFLVGIVTLAGIVLTLLGFGVSAAVQSLFHIPRGSILTSPFDALDLSVHAIIPVLRDFSFLLNSGVYSVLWRVTLLATIGSVLIWLAWPFLRRSLVPDSKRSRWSDWLVKVLGPSDPKRDSPKLIAQRFAVYTTSAAVVMPISMLVILALLYVASAVLSIIPILGYESSSSLMREYVIEAEGCVPVLNQVAWIARYKQDQARRETGDARRTVPGATCVKVIRAGGEPLYGRVAVSTGRFLVLYDPSTGATQRVPIEDAIIESVGQLPGDGS